MYGQKGKIYAIIRTKWVVKPNAYLKEKLHTVSLESIKYNSGTKH